MAQINRVGRVMIPVPNQDEAIAFYTDVLGFSLAADVPYGEGERWVEVAPPGGGTTLALVPPQGQFTPGMTGVALDSSGVKELHDQLKSAGVDVDDVMGGDGTVPPLFFFRDRHGNHLMIVEPAPG